MSLHRQKATLERQKAAREKSQSDAQRLNAQFAEQQSRLRAANVTSCVMVLVGAVIQAAVFVGLVLRLHIAVAGFRVVYFDFGRN